MRQRLLFSFFIVAATLVPRAIPQNAGSTQRAAFKSKSESPRDSCPITQPPSKPFVPPAPYPNKITADSFWLGSENLWTRRSKNGLWFGYWTTNLELGKHKIYFDKVFWWRKGYDWRVESPPQLKVTGKRLDAPAPALYAGQTQPAFIKIPAMVSGVDIPTVGCWEITGEYKGDKLSFVVRVVDP
jgi:hypothetical protein